MMFWKRWLCDVWLGHAADDNDGCALRLGPDGVKGAGDDLFTYQAVFAIGARASRVVERLARDTPERTVLLALHRSERLKIGTAAQRFDAKPAALGQLVDAACLTVVLVWDDRDMHAAATARSLAEQLRSVDARLVFGMPLAHRGCAPGAARCHPLAAHVDCVLHAPTVAAQSAAMGLTLTTEVELAEALLRRLLPVPPAGTLTGFDVTDLPVLFRARGAAHVALATAPDSSDPSLMRAVARLTDALGSAGCRGRRARHLLLWIRLAAGRTLHDGDSARERVEASLMSDQSDSLFAVALAGEVPSGLEVLVLLAGEGAR